MKRYAMICVGLLVAASCTSESDPPALTIEEAKQVAASFEGASLATSPRTIDDVLAAFEQYREVSPALAKQRDIADQPVPATNDRRELAMFHFERGSGTPNRTHGPSST